MEPTPASHSTLYKACSTSPGLCHTVASRSIVCTACIRVAHFSVIWILHLQEEDILTEGSEVERPQGTAEGLSEIGSERRYATRQTTRKQQGSQLGSTEPDKASSSAHVAYILYRGAHICRNVS